MTQPKAPGEAGLFGIKTIPLSTVLLFVNLFFFFGFYSVCADQNDRWEFVGMSQTDTRWFIDKETLYGSSGIFSFWVRSVPEKKAISEEVKENSMKEMLREIQERNFGDYGYTEALWQIDCSNLKVRILYFAVYRGDGEILNDLITPDAPWVSIMQGSAGETLRERVCK